MSNITPKINNNTRMTRSKISLPFLSTALRPTHTPTGRSGRHLSHTPQTHGQHGKEPRHSPRGHPIAGGWRA
ncbi:MAG: hypothetical protein KAI94_07130, partial [Anaerolineales bacterium]|nr:hypothetical protein [Anaerolineales bacterium]